MGCSNGKIGENSMCDTENGADCNDELCESCSFRNVIYEERKQDKP